MVLAVAVDIQDKLGITPLMAACRAGHAAAVAALLRLPWSGDLSPTADMTPLGGGFAQASADTFTPKESYTALHFAAGFGHADCVALLIRARATLDVRTVDSELTPLMMAVVAGHMAVAKLIIDAGADVSFTDAQDVSYFHVTAQRRESDFTVMMINSLLQRTGMDPIDVNAVAPDAAGPGSDPGVIAATNGAESEGAATAASAPPAAADAGAGAGGAAVSSRSWLSSFRRGSNNSAAVASPGRKAASTGRSTERRALRILNRNVLNQRRKADGCTPLYVAAQAGLLDVVKTLLAVPVPAANPFDLHLDNKPGVSGVEVDCRADNDATPLFVVRSSYRLARCAQVVLG